jgi:pyridine nucleotide-disulfide oxidoreductase family protein
VSRQRLLLVGGGHSHLFVLEALRRRAPEWRERLDVAMVSRELETPYSGMLPGLVAGHYRHKEAHVDLAPLAAAAGVELVRGSIVALDPDARMAVDAQGGQWHFDIASLDIGSTPPLSQVPGAAEHALGVKPVDAFLQAWRAFQSRAGELVRPVHIVVVGGGAGGVELALALAHRMGGRSDRVGWSLVTRGKLLPGYPPAAARRMARHLAAAGIALRSDTEVARVEEGMLHFADGGTAAFDALLWATGAGAQGWVAQSGLACIDGFVHIDSHLRSVSHPQVFAAGDIATDPLQPRAKAGVYAVRQGPVLADNLLRTVAGQPLAAYLAQRGHLSLVSTGGRHALASWRGLTWEGDWVWRWKDAIDRRFMQRFTV